LIVAASSGSGFFLIIIVAFLLLYLIVVRPQRKRQTQQQRMLSDLNVGDEVLTAGGIYGTISNLDEDRVTVQIAPTLEVQVDRRAIASVTREPEPEEDEEPEEGVEGEEGDEAEPGEEAAASVEQTDDSSGAIPARDASNEEERG
jgi:preprotein translocase subunit YajC